MNRIWVVAVTLTAQAMWSLPAGAASVGQACGRAGTTTRSSVAGQGIILCSGGVWVNAGISVQQQKLIGSELTTNAVGTSCDWAAGDRISVDASGTPLTCLNGSWVQKGGGSAATTPTSFSFTDLAAAAFNTVICSSPVTIAGLQAPAYASVSKSATGSPYVMVNGAGSASTTYATVQTGDSLQACVTTANANLTAVATAVSVGSYTTTWTVTTGNKQAASFTFGNSSPNPPPSVSWSVDTTSSAITGLTLPSPVSVVAGGGATVTALNIGGAGWAAVTGSETVQAGQTIGVRITTSGTPLVAHTVTATIGAGVSGVTPTAASFTVTNPVQDLTPDPFALNGFTYNSGDTYWYSNTVTITGITGNVPTSIDAYQYQVAGGAWTSAASTIQNGQTLQVRVPQTGTAVANMTVGTVTVAAKQANGFQLWTSGAPSFRVPPGITNVNALLVGGGAFGTGTFYTHRGGGGGAGYLAKGSLTVSTGQVVAGSIGAGGVCSSSSQSCSNASGTSFGSLFADRGASGSTADNSGALGYGGGGSSGAGGAGGPSGGPGGNGGAGGSAGSDGSGLSPGQHNGGAGAGYPDLSAIGYTFSAGAAGTGAYGSFSGVGGGAGGILINGGGPGPGACADPSAATGGTGYGAGGAASPWWGCGGNNGFVYIEYQ